jgi:NCAIR mutase (PurE)-related protein
MTEPAPHLADYATLDLQRVDRRGYPEAVYCEGKTAEQVAGIAAAVRSRPDAVTLFTRAGPEHAKAIQQELPEARYDLEARLLAWPADPPEPSGGLVVVVSAGTSDLPVAREALLTASYLGRPTELVVDVGVAGLHRVLGQRQQIDEADVVVVVAGMDGALASVIGGIAACPAIGVPTSVGYGSARGGETALQSMLCSCADGLSVVGIDDGLGAGSVAARIARRAAG